MTLPKTNNTKPTSNTGRLPQGQNQSGERSFRLSDRNRVTRTKRHSPPACSAATRRRSGAEPGQAGSIFLAVFNFCQRRLPKRSRRTRSKSVFTRSKVPVGRALVNVSARLLRLPAFAAQDRKTALEAPPVIA